MDNNQLDMSLDISGYIEEKYRDNFYRTGISMYRYDKKGSGRELLQKIKILVDQSSSMQPSDRLTLLASLSSLQTESGIYEIPYNISSFRENNEYVKFLCQTIIIPLENSTSDSREIELIESIKLLLTNLSQVNFDEIYVEPFSKSFNPKSYMEAEQITEADFPPQAKENWLLNVNTNLFFWLALMTSKDSMELVNKAFSQIGNYFKPCNPVIATDVYRIALQLPEDFTKAFFNSFESDAVRYSQIISSIESNQEKEFLACFHECDIESFGNHYYSFIKLALSFFMVYTGQSIVLPHISDYIDYDSKCVKILCGIVNDVYYKSLFNDLESPHPRVLDSEELMQILQKYDKHFTVTPPTEVVSPNDGGMTDENSNQINDRTGNRKNKTDNREDALCYLPSSTIHKIFDIEKLVKLLTSKNKFTDKSYVELGKDNNQSLKDCLTYFLSPDDETIKSKIDNHEFNVSFKLHWRGRHAVSLRCLVRLLMNADTENWAEAEDVFDPTMDDRLSRKYVSVQDDKLPIWKPVIEVFDKTAISNAGIDEKASSKTIEDNEKEIKEIINIVFACKK